MALQLPEFAKMVIFILFFLFFSNGWWMLCVLLVQWDTHHLGLQDFLIVGGGCSKSQCNGLIFGGREGGREREREMGNGKWEMARIIGISMGYSCHTLVCCWLDLNRGAIRRTGRILTRPNPFVHGMILQLAAWEKTALLLADTADCLASGSGIQLLKKEAQSCAQSSRARHTYRARVHRCQPVDWHWLGDQSLRKRCHGSTTTMMIGPATTCRWLLIATIGEYN